jgi:bifunctional DNA primase/polymerase-like protein
MQWTVHRPFVPPPVLDRLDRLRLRRAALSFAAHGWAVTPGACLDGGRFACGRPGCPILRCHPAIESWERDASIDPDRVSRWWRRRPHAVLLPTGHAFDVLEVPAALGLRVLGATRLHADVLGPGPADARGPVAVTAAGRWMFLVEPGRPLRPELAGRRDVVRHGRGSWVPAAPSRMPDGPVRWAVPPDRTRWRLPAAAAVQALLVDALTSAHPAGRRLAPASKPPAGRVAVPRQRSVSRWAA